MASSASPPVSTSFPCSVCSVSFARREHLRRHFLIHRVERPFHCPICNQTFKRRDSLKRHMQTCKTRVEAELDIPALPQQRQKGKRRKACDQCSHLKCACDFKYPCRTCSERNEPCSYERLVQKNSSVTSNSQTPHMLATPDHFQMPLDSARNGAVAEPDPDLDDWQTISNDLPILDELLTVWQQPNWDTQGLFDLASHEPSTSLNLFSQSPKNQMQPYIDEPTVSTLARNPASTFPFLTRFLQYGGLLDSFECGSLFERQQIISPQLRRRCTRGTCSDDNDPAINIQDLPSEIGPVDVASPSLSDALFTRTECRPHLHYTQMLLTDASPPNDLINLTPNVVMDDQSHSTTTSSSGIHEVYQSTAVKIVRMIKEVAFFKPRGSKIPIDWSPVIEQACLEFFSPLNLEKFLILFWSCWYANCPILHKPTFMAETRSPALVASLALIGACVSPDPADRIRASVWFDNVEEVVFSDELLQDESIEFSHDSVYDDPKVWGRLDALQAAFHICVLQNWEGSMESKRRIRRYRYTTVVAIARELGLEKTTLGDLQLKNFSQFKWTDFILRETLIRTATYIFLVDSYFVVFHHSPPRIMLAELQMDLTCSEACFEAETAEGCFALLYSWARSSQSQPRLSIPRAVELLCGTPDQSLDVFQNLSILNMFTIVTALHTLVFNCQTSLTCSESTITSAERGLMQWSWAWNNGCYMSKLRNFCAGEDMWKHTGFIQHGPEFCLLARVVLEQLKLQQDSNYESRAAWSSSNGRKSNGAKFDNSDMSQVTQLIRKFQHFSVSELQYPWL